LHVENSVIDAKIVATTRYFPSVDGDAVVADLPTWLTAANTVEPGVARASELWLDAKPPANLPLVVTSQCARASELTSDPLARGAIALLLVTALVGLALAAVGLMLTVVGDLRDERGSLQDLEAQGATPAELRRHVLLRAAVVGVLGLAGGIAAGAIVGALVVAVVSVTAGAENALPPLVLAFDWPLILIVLGALVAYSAAGATAATRRLR
jgi:predicted lysophospholipase L1 biosynthesis ABC-type transport system permease subunit